MTFSCVVLPAELVSRELDAAKSTVARFEHLDHLSIMFCLLPAAMYETTSMGTCGWKRLSMPSLKPGGSPDFKCTSALICIDLKETTTLQDPTNNDTFSGISRNMSPSHGSRSVQEMRTSILRAIFDNCIMCLDWTP